MRQTAAEIDHAILDVAAGIFATHGYAHTSVQQVADAVGYSKPGLLHRFGSKESLYRAVLAEVAETVEQVVTCAEASVNLPEPETRLMELVARKALARPGIVRMMLRALDATKSDPGVESVRAAGHRLVDVLDRPVGSPMERLRVVLALELIATAASAQQSRVDAHLHVDPTELVSTIVPLAVRVMGAQPVRVSEPVPV